MYNPQQERIILRLEENSIAIGIVAVLRRFKRHDLFLRAASELIKKYPDLKFIIAGDGPKRESLYSLAQELEILNSIVFLGHVNEPAKILSALDIFVLTSDSNEGVPQSVMQALLMNKNVVATNAGSTKDLYHNNNFLLINTDDLSAIIYAIESLIKNPKQLNLQPNFIIDNFSKTIMIKKIIDCYYKVLAL